MPSTCEDKCHTGQALCDQSPSVYGLAVLALQALGRLHFLTKTESSWKIKNQFYKSAVLLED